jgi:hypothetical protein
MTRIKRRDGTFHDAPDGYILADGESLVVDVRFMDSVQRAIADGQDVIDEAQVIADAQAASAACCDAMRAAEAERVAFNERAYGWKRDAWMGDRDGDAVEPRTTIVAPTDADIAAGYAAVDAAYAAHHEWLQNAWKGDAK